MRTWGGSSFYLPLLIFVCAEDSVAGLIGSLTLASLDLIRRGTIWVAGPSRYNGLRYDHVSRTLRIPTSF
jgi:hypothetical protein